MRITKYNILLDSSSGTPELIKESSKNYATDHNLNCVNNTKEAVCMINNLFHMDQLAEEYVYMIAFNTKCRALGVFEVSHGDISRCLITPREIYQRALLIGAASIIIFHNHPSGDVVPSPEDIEVTKRLNEAGKLIGISLLDHIIIGGKKYLSLREYALG